MPSIALTDLTVRNLKPVPGKRVTYLDKALKGFGVRVTEHGAKSYVLTYGEDRKRITLGIVGTPRRNSRIARSSTRHTSAALSEVSATSA